MPWSTVLATKNMRNNNCIRGPLKHQSVLQIYVYVWLHVSGCLCMFDISVWVWEKETLSKRKEEIERKVIFFLSISITRMINLDGVTCQWNKSLRTWCLHFVNISETWWLQMSWCQIVITTTIQHSGNHHMDHPTQTFLIMRLIRFCLSILNESIANSFCIFEIKHYIIWNHMFIFIFDIASCPLQEPESSYMYQSN